MSLQINRRDFLARAGAGLAGIGLATVSPIAETFATFPSEHIKINSYGARRVLWIYAGVHGGLPKLFPETSLDYCESRDPNVFNRVFEEYSRIYPLYKWPDLKKQYPQAFTKTYYSGEQVIENSVEEDAWYVIENELADRATDYYLKEFASKAPGYNRDALGWQLRNYMFTQVRELLLTQKKIPGSSLSVGESLD